MEKRTCSTCGRDESSISRGMCPTCYGRAWRAGEIGPDTRHRLTAVNYAERTAECSRCGPVAIKVRVRDGRKKAECKTTVREEKRRYQKVRGSRAGQKNYRTQDSTARWKYGLSQDELDSLREQAGGRCMVCHRDFVETPHIDHCHSTGIVRGLLCRRCNFAIGWLDDDPSRALSVHQYLANGGAWDRASDKTSP